MMSGIDTALCKIINNSVHVEASSLYPDTPEASVLIVFSDGARLEADYWRLIKDARADVSSFDHQQQYGLPAPIDAIKGLQEELNGKTLTAANLDHESGDLLFQFSEGVKLRIFNFTGYEAWHISFPDGTGEYSNYAK